MTITLQTDSVSFKRKPEPKDIKGIKRQLCESKPINTTLDELEQCILGGVTYTPAILTGGSKAENWQCQQVFCIDIDNEDKNTPKPKKGDKAVKRQSETPLGVSEVIKRCESWNIAPALIYETFSSTPQWLKFRIVFISSEVITDGSKRDLIQLGLQEIFPECDSSCKNRDRLFFGGKRTLYKNDKAVYFLDSIARLGKARNDRRTFERFVHNSNSGELETLKREFDFLGYIRGFGGRETKAGQLIRFNPCPICGHNDDFYYYPDTNSFKCFGASGNVGGTVIDFIMHTQNIDKKSAFDIFKYQLCGLSRNEEKAKYRKDCMIKKAENNGVVTGGELPPYIIEKADKDGNIRYLISCPLLADFIRHNSDYMFVRDRATDYARCYWYENGRYNFINEQELKGIIKKYITDFDLTLLKMRDVTEVFNDLMSDRRFIKEDQLNADENIINFQNGLLYLDTLELKEHTPEIYSTIQIPCDWNPKKSVVNGAPIFESFLNTFTENNPDKKKLLLQYIGVCISNISGHRMKKSLFMVGAGNTGKSQLKALTEKLLGFGNSAAIDLSELEERFGTSKIYGKRLSGSSDMSYVTVNELKVFKQVTGGDAIFAEFKGKPSFEFVYKGLMWFCTNQLPKFGGDRGDWVYDRIITFRCDNVIPPERQDKLLLDKMYAEREAIAYLVALGAKQVIDNGYNFDIPEDCLLEREQYKKNNSPVAMFFEECCEMRKSEKITDNCTTKKMYEVFKAWCVDNNRSYAPSNQDF